MVTLRIRHVALVEPIVVPCSPWMARLCSLLAVCISLGSHWLDKSLAIEDHVLPEVGLSAYRGVSTLLRVDLSIRNSLLVTQLRPRRMLHLHAILPLLIRQLII